MEPTKTLYFSAGEPSGDLHAAKLMSSLRSVGGSMVFRGVGGPRMRQAGCLVDYPLTDLATIGFVEVLPKLREFFRVADLVSASLDKHRPDAVVLIDFPGFNWHVAKRAKQRGIPVYYYLPPQLWAWGQWRIHKMRRLVDQVLCNLPFERDWFQQRGLSTHLVGHPFFDEVHGRELDQRFLSRWGNYSAVQVAVLPGSRAREVRHIWPMQLAAIRELSRRHPEARFLVACLKDGHCLWCKQQLAAADRDLKVEFFVGRTSEVAQLADCALMKSGSVSLEMMARGVPSVVVYQVGRVFYHIARQLTDLNTFSLPNLLAGRSVMSEHLAVGSCQAATRSSIEALDRLMGDPVERQRQRDQLLQLAQQYAAPGASQRAAEVILTTLAADRRASTCTDAA